MNTRTLLLSSLLPLSAAHAALVVNETFDYGSVDRASGYGTWADTTDRWWYESGRNLGFVHAAFGSGGNAGTGVGESDNYSAPRGAQLAFANPGLSGQIWLSALVRVLSGANANEGIMLSVHDIAYNNNGPSKGCFGIGNAGGGVYGAMFVPTASGTPVFGSDTSFTAGSTDAATYLLIAKMTITGGADTLSLWLLKASDSFGWTEASLGTPDLTTTAADFGSSARNLWIGQKAAAGNVDLIRISGVTGDRGLREVLTGLPAPAHGTVILIR